MSFAGEAPAKSVSEEPLPEEQLGPDQVEAYRKELCSGDSARMVAAVEQLRKLFASEEPDLLPFELAMPLIPALVEILEASADVELLYQLIWLISNLCYVPEISGAIIATGALLDFVRHLGFGGKVAEVVILGLGNLAESFSEEVRESGAVPALGELLTRQPPVDAPHLENFCWALGNISRSSPVSEEVGFQILGVVELLILRRPDLYAQNSAHKDLLWAVSESLRQKSVAERASGNVVTLVLASLATPISALQNLSCRSILHLSRANNPTFDELAERCMLPLLAFLSGDRHRGVKIAALKAILGLASSEKHANMVAMDPITDQVVVLLHSADEAIRDLAIRVLLQLSESDSAGRFFAPEENEERGREALRRGRKPGLFEGLTLGLRELWGGEKRLEFLPTFQSTIVFENACEQMLRSGERVFEDSAVEKLLTIVERRSNEPVFGELLAILEELDEKSDQPPPAMEENACTEENVQLKQ